MRMTSEPLGVEFWTKEDDDGTLRTAVIDIEPDRTVIVSVELLREMLAELGFTYGDTMPEHYGSGRQA